MTDIDLEEFFRAYATCALWSSIDENEEPLDANYSADDIAPECAQAMRETCADFIQSNRADLIEYCQQMHCEQWSGSSLAGHDFWLTRNGHGAGFWDRGLGDLGKRLTKAADVYGGIDLYLGDDGFIYGER